MRFLRIGLWNVNGLAQRSQEVEVLLHFNKLDILLITETHFTNKNYFKIKGYNFYNTQHPNGTARGGTAILIKQSIKHNEMPGYKTHEIQATSVQIQDWLGDFVISAVYCPPRHRITAQLFSDYFTTLGNRFLSGGDWNAKHVHWGSRLITPRGRELKRCVDIFRYDTLSAGQPTYWPTDRNKIPDLLDFFVSNGIGRFYIDMENCLDSMVDHSPIIATVSTEVIKRNVSFKLYNKQTDWHAFSSWIDDSINLNRRFQNENDIDEAVEYLNHSIQEAARHSTPDTEQLDLVETCHYPREIRIKISEKRRLRRIWQNSRNPIDKTILNRATKELKEIIQQNKNDTLRLHMEGLSVDKQTDYSLWKATKRLKRPEMNIPPLRTATGDWAKSDKEKSELYADYLSGVFKQNLSADSEDIIKFLEAPFQMSPPIKFFTVGEVKSSIKKLRPRKAPGYDYITAELLQHLPRKCLVFITTLFNSVMRLCYYPYQWKFSEIQMIPKPGKPLEAVSSYRPISLLPILSKVFERLLINRMKPFVDEMNLLPDHQFGFRNGHSTIEQLHRVVHIITDCLETKKYCSAVFLDIQQAFDKVWHIGLLYKIKQTLPHHFFMILKSYLANRFYQVKHQSEFSTFKDINSGVPQGSVLGPILYSLYTFDLPESDNVHIATFADDTALLACSEDPGEASNLLQEQINKIQQWLEKWKVNVNTAKSAHITFTMRRQTCPEVKLNNVQLPRKDTVKYLGMHLDRRLNWRAHINAKRQELQLKYRKLYWLIGKNSAISLENKCLLYKVILKPIWTYGIQLWGTASSSNIEILQRFQNKVLRSISNAPWFTRNTEIHDYLEIPSVIDEVKRISIDYQERLSRHVNQLAINLLDNSNDIRRLKRYHVLELDTRI
jgi:hypothetical protein